MSREMAEFVRSEAAAREDVHVLEAVGVEFPAEFPKDVFEVTAPRPGGVDTDAVQIVTERVRRAEHLVFLVGEGVTERDPWHLLADGRVERLPRLLLIARAETEQQGVGHGSAGFPSEYLARGDV